MNPGMHPLVKGLPAPWAVEWGEDRFGVFESFAIGDVVQRMRWVPPGRFLMGSPEGEAGRWEDEGPQHEVTISRGLWLGETPCTQALWRAVMGESPSAFVSPDRPVEQVSWDDCQIFVERINRLMPGFGARLPTEAEWEYACRGGTTAATWVGDLGILGESNAPVLDAIAWYAGNSDVDFDLNDGKQDRGTHRVKRKHPNPLGLYDMLGNVHEWCGDWFERYVATPQVDPTGAAAGSSRVYRGGSWLSDARIVRAAYRGAYLPGNRYGILGFRLARGQVLGPGAEPLADGERSRRPEGAGAGRDGARAR